MSSAYDLELQAQLTEMNLALDGYSSGQSRQLMQNETVALRERNEKVQNQLEKMFTERQSRESSNSVLEQEIERERNKINEMVYKLPGDEQVKYAKLRTISENLKGLNVDFHNRVGALAKQKERMHSILNSSQPRIDAVQLSILYKDLLEKKATYKEEQKNRLTPAQEREKLIADVRNNNQSLISINKQIKVIEEQLAAKRELLSQIDQDLEEGNSERHTKYKELNKRDESMTAFLEEFPQKVHAEKRSK